MHQPLPPNRSRFPVVLWACLLALASTHAVMAVLAMREKSTTADEIAHLTGGYTFNHWNDYRLHPENGLLPQRWAALPATLSHPAYPDLSGDDWRDANVWAIGYDFFYNSGNDPDKMLLRARMMNALWGAATVLLVGVLALRLFGPAGALAATGFAVFCPTMLAHTPLATSDMAMCFFLLASVSCYWWHLHDPRWRVLLLSSLAFGLACVAKFTAVLLLPMFTLMALVRIVAGPPLRCFGRACPNPLARSAFIAGTTIVHGLVALAVIWTFYGWRYTAFNPALPGGDFAHAWDYVLSYGGWKARVIELCRSWHLLPEGFLHGFAFVLKYSLARGAFLDGDYSIHGWASFFPKAFLYKTPPTLLLATALSAGWVVLWVRERGRTALFSRAYRVAPLLVLFAVYWVSSLASNLNIGHRHLLPVYPVLYVFCGLIGWAVVTTWRQRTAAGALTGVIGLALVGWHAAGAVRIHPHHLAYFSPLAGGPAQGYRHLVDSSLDWGQDLPGLKHWLDGHRRPDETVYLSYFGTGAPEHYGIEAVRLLTLPEQGPARPRHRLEPGLYAISATMLQHAYSNVRGPWTMENEQRYQRLRENEDSFLRGADDASTDPGDPTPAEWAHAWSIYEPLRFARLCHYLRVRKPDAMIGYSILVFRLDRHELDAALRGSARDLGAAIERALAEASP